ncbi:hypothetical protein [Caballeronia sp. J97]|uniref:hypothetical protein n=1 Tax=Caballeronia sp. J97 TaxID=2805429 RepID=UPI002AB14A8E|nr:hypothetical protein [Caballeronia sp. J97]
MQRKNASSNVPLVRGGVLLKDVRGGFLTRIIDSNEFEAVNYVLRCEDGSLYCCQLDIAVYENRNNLLMMAFDYGLPVTLSGDENGNITGLAVARSNAPLPSLNCGFLKLQDSRTGMVVRIVDKNQGAAITYVLQTEDGARYCVNMWPNQDTFDNRNVLFMMALRTNMAVTVSGGLHHEVTAIAVGS